MNYRQIVADAWHFAQEEKRLMYFYAFLPALITTIAGIIYVLYQGMSLKRYFAHESSVLVDLVKAGWKLIGHSPQLSFFALIVITIIAVLYLLYPSFNEGALIQFIARRKNGQTIKMRQGLRYGSRSFFPILEFNGILGAFSLSALIGYATLILRNLGSEPLQFIGPILAIAGLITVVASFLFTYARFYIAIDGMGVFEAMSKSTRLVIDHLESTILMFLILLLIALRIVLNILLIIVIPGLIVLIAGFFASLTLSYLGYSFALAIGLAGLYIAGYLGGILSVFSHAVWTFTFLELTGDEEKSARDT